MSNPIAIWKKEIKYETSRSIGYVIGTGGRHVHRWINKYNCTITIDEKNKTIIIIGYDELSVIQTTLEVQERLLVSWKYINKEYEHTFYDCDYDIKELTDKVNDLNSDISLKDYEIEQLNKSIQETNKILYKLPLPNLNGMFESFETFEHYMTNTDLCTD